MKAVVVYESLWGNTAAVARAVAEGIGSRTRRSPTADAGAAEALAGVDLWSRALPCWVSSCRRTRCARACGQPRQGAGAARPIAPVDALLARGVAGGRAVAAPPSIPSVRGSLGHRRSPGLRQRSKKAGYRAVGKPRSFVVTGKFGPLRNGELEQARGRGEAELAKAVEAP